jgi:hypothetical protein
MLSAPSPLLVESGLQVDELADLAAGGRTGPDRRSTDPTVLVHIAHASGFEVADQLDERGVHDVRHVDGRTTGPLVFVDADLVRKVVDLVQLDPVDPVDADEVVARSTFEHERTGHQAREQAASGDLGGGTIEGRHELAVAGLCFSPDAEEIRHRDADESGIREDHACSAPARVGFDEVEILDEHAVDLEQVAAFAVHEAAVHATVLEGSRRDPRAEGYTSFARGE